MKHSFLSALRDSLHHSSPSKSSERDEAARARLIANRLTMLLGQPTGQEQQLLSGSAPGSPQPLTEANNAV